MRISHQKKFIYLAIPRTGSVSMRNLLTPVSDICGVLEHETTPEHPFHHHMTASELHAIFQQRGWCWDDYTRFCVVRNPYDRVVSLYHRWLRDFERHKQSGWRGRLRKLFCRRRTFRQYVDRLNPARRMPISLEHFINDDEGGPMITEVLCLEKLEEQLPALLERLGIDMPAAGMPHANRSEGRHDYRSYYDAETRRRVAQLYAGEIERFGYDF